MEMTKPDRRKDSLESELERLKRTLNLGHELKVKWLPGHVKHFDSRRLIGEVLGETIFVYAESEAEALRTVKHEFIEHVLANSFTEPYRRMINTLIEAFEKEARRHKERVVERLTDVI